MTHAIVRCDDCDWEEPVNTWAHMRAWYRVACPKCGQGEIIDAQEVRVLEELLALQSLGLVRLDQGEPKDGETRAVIDTREAPMLKVLAEGQS